LVLAEHFRTLRGFELQLVPGHTPVERIVASLQALAILEGRIFVSTCAELSSGYRDADRHALARWAGEAAAAVESWTRWPVPPVLAPGVAEAVHDVADAAHGVTESVLIQERA
jgi:hypothetical protein